jgi:hypothetical protein
MLRRHLRRQLRRQLRQRRSQRRLGVAVGIAVGVAFAIAVAIAFGIAVGVGVGVECNRSGVESASERAAGEGRDGKGSCVESFSLEHGPFVLHATESFEIMERSGLHALTPAVASTP